MMNFFFITKHFYYKNLNFQKKTEVLKKHLANNDSKATKLQTKARKEILAKNDTVALMIL